MILAAIVLGTVSFRITVMIESAGAWAADTGAITALQQRLNWNLLLLAEQIPLHSTAMVLRIILSANVFEEGEAVKIIFDRHFCIHIQ